jgi:hypothetical protein
MLPWDNSSCLITVAVPDESILNKSSLLVNG